MFISTLLLLITPPFTHSPFARLTACVGILRELGGGGKEHRRAHWPWQSGTLAGSCISAFLLVPQPGAAKSEGGDWFEGEVDRGTFPTVIFIERSLQEEDRALGTSPQRFLAALHVSSWEIRVR